MLISMRTYVAIKEETGLLFEGLHCIFTCLAQLCLGLEMGREESAENILLLSACYLFMVSKMLCLLEENNATLPKIFH